MDNIHGFVSPKITSFVLFYLIIIIIIIMQSLTSGKLTSDLIKTPVPRLHNAVAKFIS